MNIVALGIETPGISTTAHIRNTIMCLL